MSPAILALVTGLLSVVPGIPAGVLAFVTAVINVLPQLEKAGADMVAFVETQVNSIKSMIAEGRDPNQGEWSTLNASIIAELVKLSQAAQQA